MKTELYEQYIEHRTAGRKHDASDTIRRFVASCTGPTDRDAWVRGFLNQADSDERIRHEVYSGLIFPVLLDGYERKEFWSTYWLARTAANLYASSSLHAQVGYKSELHFLKEAMELNPTDDVRRRLLAAYVAEFEHSQHEWPAGILSGMDGATLDECGVILADIKFAHHLDDGTQRPFLEQFERKVREYIGRLESRNGEMKS